MGDIADEHADRMIDYWPSRAGNRESPQCRYCYTFNVEWKFRGQRWVLVNRDSGAPHFSTCKAYKNERIEEAKDEFDGFTDDPA